MLRLSWLYHNRQHADGRNIQSHARLFYRRKLVALDGPGVFVVGGGGHRRPQPDRARRTLAYVLPRGMVVIDCSPHSSSSSAAAAASTSNSTRMAAAGSVRCRVPSPPFDWQEFPNDDDDKSFLHSPRTLAMARTFWRAVQRVLEPPTLHVLAAAGGATLGIGAVEGTLLCREWPIIESLDAARFVLYYTTQNLFPSVVWETHDAVLVATSLGLDPTVLLHDLSGHNADSATLLLRTQWLGTARYFFAGFMMIAQLFRAATISTDCWTEYQQRIVNGREPPLRIPKGGLIVRLCGLDSHHLTEVSLKRMGSHLFPVFEHPETVRFLVRQYSLGKQRPVYWCCRPGLYWRKHSWERFPAHMDCLVMADRDPHDKILILEADATNGNDPLSIGNTALDLTLEDASEGFRRILQRYRQRGLEAGRDFRTLRVYLGNSMEVTQTGGGHSYTIRHRVRYAKEMDVLVDSRAPVLSKLLDWCASVTAGKKDDDKKIFFQTSSREYFLNLKSLLKQYGYDIYDPLDLRMLHTLRASLQKQEEQQQHPANTMDGSTNDNAARSFLGVLLDDPKYLAEELDEHGAFLSNSFFAAPTAALAKDHDSSSNNKSDLGGAGAGAGEVCKDGQAREVAPASGKATAAVVATTAKEMLRKVVRLAKLPRLVHMETTAKTVNAVEALITVGEVDASSCCALLDRHEGVVVLEETLQHRSEFVQSQKYQWQRKGSSSGGSSEASSPSRTGTAGATDEEPTSDVNDGEGSDPSSTIVTTARSPKAPSLGTGGGLQFICSSSIHDDILRQVRYWARQGYSAAAIQNEIDTQYQAILLQSHTVQKQVTTMTTADGSAAAAATSATTVAAKANNASSPSSGTAESPTDKEKKTVPR
jgi:hypothetical protein